MTTRNVASRKPEVGPRTGFRTESSVPGIPRKPIENAPHPKPLYATDEECARLLESLLRRMPSHLIGDKHSRFPLTDALQAFDASQGTGTARELIFIAAVNHRAADERRTAEYLLRNRQDVLDGERSAKSLLLAARCAAELDVRRVRNSESTLPRSLAAPSIGDPALADSPGSGDIVLDRLRAVVGEEAVTPQLAEWLHDAVNVVLEVAMRHTLNGGKGSAVLAMRADARPDSRLLTHLRKEFGNETVARNLARLLVGADHTPIETALLWWSVPHGSEGDVPEHLRRRWMRYLHNCVKPRPRRRAVVIHSQNEVVDDVWTRPIESEVPDAASPDPTRARHIQVHHEPVVGEVERMTVPVAGRSTRRAMDANLATAAGSQGRNR